jgi:hypothetical protein
MTATDAVKCCVLVFALGLVSCIPIPIRHDELVTPKVVGELRASDGRPAAGAALALTASDRDTLCADASVRRVAEDQGRFLAPPVEERKTIFWFVFMENFGLTSYWLCAGRIDSSGTPVYVDRTYIHGHQSGDSLACLTWEWNERERLACNLPFTKRIFEGGLWVQGSVRGRYRLIVADDHVWAWRCRAFLQWLEAPMQSGPERVAATAQLGDGMICSEVPEAPLDRRTDRWYVHLPSIKRTTWGHVRWQSYELGAPGDAHNVSGP